MLEYFIETVFSLGMFINAALFIPQILRLVKTQNADDLSLITFAGFSMIQLFAILHGYLHDDTVLMIGMGLSLLTCGTVTVLITLLRLKQYFKRSQQPDEAKHQ